MNPSENPPITTPEPTPTGQTPGVASAPAAVPTQPAPGVSAAPVPPLPAPSSKKLPLIIAGLVGGLLIILVLVLGWFTLWSPQAKAKRLSNSFMHAMTTGDVSKAVELSGDSSAKDFLQTASDKVKGSYKMSDSTYQDSKGYYLYTLSGADKKYARTIVAKDDGKLVVHSFVYSNDKLRLIPGDSAESTDTTATTSPSTTTTTASNCLVKSDFDTIINTRQSTTTGATQDYTSGSSNFLSDAIGFKPDSLAYDNPFPDAAQETISQFAAFYKQNSSKQFVIRLSGGVGTNKASDLDFANQRAAKVQADLIAQGVPKDRIVIDAPFNNTAIGGDGSTEADMSFTRDVDLKIDATCSTATTNNTTTGK